MELLLRTRQQRGERTQRYLLPSRIRIFASLSALRILGSRRFVEIRVRHPVGDRRTTLRSFAACIFQEQVDASANRRFWLTPKPPGFSSIATLGDFSYFPRMRGLVLAALRVVLAVSYSNRARGAAAPGPKRRARMVDMVYANSNHVALPGGGRSGRRVSSDIAGR